MRNKCKSQVLIFPSTIETTDKYWSANRTYVKSLDRKEPTRIRRRFRRCLLDSYPQCLSYGRVRWIVGQGNVAPFSQRGWLDGLSNLGRGSIEGANVPQAGNAVSILHPLSLRSLAYFYSSLSETWVGSSPFPLEEFFLLARRQPPPSVAVAAFYLFPSGYRCGDNNMQTFWYLQFECRKTGTESHGGTARGGPLNFSKTQPRLRAILLTAWIRVVTETAIVRRQIFKKRTRSSRWLFYIIFRRLIFLQLLIRPSVCYKVYIK